MEYIATEIVEFKNGSFLYNSYKSVKNWWLKELAQVCTLQLYILKPPFYDECAYILYYTTVPFGFISYWALQVNKFNISVRKDLAHTVFLSLTAAVVNFVLLKYLVSYKSV
jgi:hypothetical protein